MLFLAGERAYPDTIHWAGAPSKLPIIDHWWDTEASWPFAANPVGLGLFGLNHGSPTVPMPGYDLRVLDANNKPVPRGQTGSLAIQLAPAARLPADLVGKRQALPRQLSRESIPADENTWPTPGYIDEDGYVFVMARTDDIINVAGHRLSTGALEEVVASHPDVAECAVIGIADHAQGQQVPAGFIVLKSGC